MKEARGEEVWFDKLNYDDRNEGLFVPLIVSNSKLGRVFWQAMSLDYSNNAG
jgi:hypothetical protein